MRKLMLLALAGTTACVKPTNDAGLCIAAGQDVAALRRALLRNRSATVRTGRFFQAVAGPLLARFAPLALSRRIQARYFGLD